MDSLNERVASAAADLAALLGRLEAEIPHRPSGGGEGGGKSGHRPLAAWNTPAAMLVMDVHAGVRELEAALQAATAGRSRRRGGSTQVTMSILGQIPALAAGTPAPSAVSAARQLESWCWRARIVLGEREEWKHLPRVAGQPVPRCPWCRFTTLRYKPAAGILRCLNPGCRDTEGNRPEARVEFGPVSGEPLFTWQDSTSGMPS